MNDVNIERNQSEEEVLTFDVSDEVVEAAATNAPDPYKSILLQFGC